VSNVEIRSFNAVEGASEFDRVEGKAAGSTTSSQFLVKCRKVAGLTTGEGFFADAVLLIEGKTEQGLLMELSNILSLRMDERNVVMVSGCGKETLPRAAIIFRGLGIKTFVVWDNDKLHRNTANEQNTIRQNQKLLRLVSAGHEDPWAGGVFADHAIMDNTIEDVCREAVGLEIYDVLQKDAMRHLEVSSGDPMKSVEGAATFIRLLYEKGLKVPMLEDLLRRAEGGVEADRSPLGPPLDAVG